MSRQPELLAGQLLADRYRLQAQIGRGGIGTVWRSHDEQTGQTLAVKVVPTVDSHGIRSPNKIGRFLREARAMARLKSPYVVQVFDHGSCHLESGEEVVYLTMELMVGESLRDRLERQSPLDAATTMTILGQVGRAVALAHSRGIVHRDLKPANIFIIDDGSGESTATEITCKVLDFGMAKSVAAPLATADGVLTELGRPLGTPYYMSPEQARGLESVDHRTDLWAMGVIAYEGLVGERPFRGKSLAKVFADIAAGPIPVPSDHGNVPEGFDAWFLRAVARDVQQRFQSAKLMIEELREVLIDASLLSRSHSGLTSTISDLNLTTAAVAVVGERTLRRVPVGEHGSSFLARRNVLEEIDRSLASHCRVVTLTGARGAGRTRIAREWARTAASRFPGGVWLCALDHVREPDQMWLRLSTSLGIRSSDNSAPLRLGRALSGLGRVLVIFERPDRVRQHLATALSRWLVLAPHAVFVSSTSKAFGVATERVIPVPDLDVPPPSETGDLQTLKRYAAVELLVRRAMAFDRQILARADQAGALAAVVRKIGGHPLAIELVAARTGDQPLEAITSSLSASLVHAGGTHIIHPDTVARHVTAWAIGELSPPLRATISQLAAFHGDFTLAAAEAVVDLASFADAPPVAELVGQLAREGFLRVAEDVSDQRRYDLHPLIHDVARERLASGADLGEGTLDQRLEAVYTRHGTYYAQLGAEGALEALSQRGGWVRHARYFAEAENLGVASERAIGRDDARTAAACALAMSAIESLTGREAKAVQRLVATTSLSGLAISDRIRCQMARGEALVRDRRLDSAAQVLEGAASEARAGGDQRLYAGSLRSLARHRLAACRHEEARGLAEQAGALSAQHGDRTGHAVSMEILGICAHAKGDLVGAKRLLQQARITYDQLGERSLEATAFLRIAEVHADQGRTDQALAALDASLTIRRELGNRYEEALGMGLEGEITLQAGQTQRAGELLEAAVIRCREVGACHLEGRFMGAQASFQLATGSPDLAFRTFEDADRLLQSDDPHGSFELVLVLCRRLQAESVQGASDAARHTMGRIQQLSIDLGPAPLAVRRAVTAARGLSRPRESPR